MDTGHDAGIILPRWILNMSSKRPWRGWLALLIAGALTGVGNGCYYDVSYAIVINTWATSSTVYAGNEVGLWATITTDHTRVTVMSQSWSVVSGGTNYTLTDQGANASAVFLAPGTYSICYQVSYLAEHDHAETQWSYQTIRVLPLPAG
jgi:hypothetical protein